MTSNTPGIVALVTGGATGVGRSVALKVAARGGMIAINYSRSDADARKTVADAMTAGGAAISLQGDVADPSVSGRLVEQTLERFGRLDLLVNNAGYTEFISYADLDAIGDETWDRIFDVNLKGAFYCSRAAAKAMRAGGGGSIVNVASVAGLTGSGSSIPYACSKAAMIALTKALATALAPEIRVNAVAPGYIHTRWHAGHEDEWYERTRKGIPLKRLGTADDMADAVIALGLNVTHATGQTLVVDGGRLMH